MSEKILKSRIVHKHDVAANWALATNFSPLKGEIIVYDPDENNAQPRVKVGDGETNVNDLPFVTDISKPTDLIVNMTAGFVTGKGVVYSCDTPFADMWAAYEDGGNVMFFIDGIHTSNVEFLIARADDAKSIHLAYINGSVYLEYTINEDNTVTWKSDNLITRTTLEQTTGTSTTKVMTQKAVTEALALKADQTALDAVSALVGDEPVAEQIDEVVSVKQDKNLIVNITHTTADDGTKTYSADKTFAEVNEAITSGVDVVLYYSQMYFTLSMYSGVSAIFTSSQAVTGCIMSTITWNGNSGKIAYKTANAQTIADRKTTLSADSTHGSYPSAKAVVDYVDEAIGNINLDTYEFITVADIDEICGNVTEGGLPQSDIDELMTKLG